MRRRIFAFSLVFLLTCAFLGIAFLRSQQEKSVTLAELASGDYRSDGPTRMLMKVGQSGGSTWMNSPDIDLIFYAVLGICAILLALRVIVSAIRIKRAERFGKIQERRSENFRAARSVQKEWVSFDTASAPEPLKETYVNLRESSLANATRVKLAGSSSQINRWPTLRAFGRGFSGKLILVFTGIIAAFGFLTIAVVYLQLGASLTAHALKRARVLAVNVGDSAPAYLLKKNQTPLSEFLRKIANSPGVAYVLVEDRKKNIFAHSFAVLPQEMKRAEPSDEVSDKPRILRLGEGSVYEIRVPILEGQIGAVRVALWKKEIDASINATLTPMIELIAFVILAGMLLAVFLVWRIARPILRLVRTARRISEGDLDTPSVGAVDTTEFGELSRALERMRSSVKAAMTRLQQDR